MKCCKIFDLFVNKPIDPWILAIDIQKIIPDFSMSGASSVSTGINASAVYGAQCLALGGTTWSAAALPATFYVCERNGNLLYAIDPMTVAMVFCDASANISFQNVTLHPTIAWDGGPFTLLITSNDPKVSFSPSSVNITNGFNSDIILTLTCSNPQTIQQLSDVTGVCQIPVADQFSFNTTPALSY